MDSLPPEISASIVGFVVFFIATMRYLIRELAQIRVQNEKQDTEKDKIINTFVVDFNARLEQKDGEVKELRDSLKEVEVSLGVERGKIIAITEAHNQERINWNAQRIELVDKIERLEKRIAELEHEKRSNIELIGQLQTERDALKRQIKDRDKLVLDLTSKNSELELSLLNCQKEKQEVTKTTDPLQNKIKALKPDEVENEATDNPAA